MRIGPVGNILVMICVTFDLGICAAADADIAVFVVSGCVVAFVATFLIWVVGRIVSLLTIGRNW